MELPTGKAVTYSYDPLARLSEVGIDGIVNTSYTYESAGTGKTTPLVSSVTTNGKKTEYTYDAYGNILTITEDGVLTHSYTYDARSQLIGEVSGADTYVYNYDAGGNLQSVQKNGETVKTYAYGDESWKDLLTSFNGQAITYDAIGNPLTYRGWTLTWTGGRRLASIAGEGLTAAYTYNADGVRTQKTVNGVTTQYYLDGTSILRQVSGDDVLEFFYDTDSVLGFYYNGTPYYYLKNMQGDVVGILDSTGTQVVAYSYDAWGTPLSVTGTLADTLGQLNPFRYGSYYYDTETGLYYLNSRYYDAETGRFLNADGYVSTGYELTSCNMFAYCMNNPVVMVDTTGNFPWLVIAVIGTCVVIGGVLGAMSDRKLHDVTMSSSNNSNNSPAHNNNFVSPKNPTNGLNNQTNNFAHNNNSTSSSTRANTSNNQATGVNASSNQKSTLSTTDRLMNIFIGATLGLGVGGALVATGGAIVTVAFPSGAIAGVAGTQIFAIGALAFDLEAIVFAPFYSVELEPIEWVSD